MIIPALVLALSAAAATAVPLPRSIPSGASNCALAAPPEAAGEILMHGSVTKVFPRLPDIEAKYTGCQMTWVSVDEEMVLASVVYFKKGRPSRIWSPAFDDGRNVCKYRKERLVSGPPELCPGYEELAVPSMPPGCATKIAEGTAGEGECSYE